MKPFRSPHNISRAVMLLFGLGALLGVVAVAGEVVTLEFLGRIAADLEATASEGEAIDSFITTVGLLQVGASIISFISLLVWVYRVHSNLPALGATYLTLTPGWAVGNFLIPIFNLFGIPRVMREIWQASDPALPQMTDVPTRKRSKGAWLIDTWCIVLYLTGAVNRLSGSLGRQADTLDQVINQVYVAIAAEVVAILFCVLTIVLIRAIDQRQHKRFELTRPSSLRPGAGLTLVAVPNTLRSLTPAIPVDSKGNPSIVPESGGAK